MTSASMARDRSGRRGEALVAAHLGSIGWTVLARRLHVGRDEIDLLAVDPGPPRAVVVVEVRTRTSSRYGTAEESVDRRKIARLYRAAAALRALGTLPGGAPLPRGPWRVDVLTVDDAPAIAPGAGGPTIRHHRAVEPG